MTSQPDADAIIVQAEDEGVHDHGVDTDPLWSESHYMDTVSPDGTSGVYVRLGRLPNQERSHVMLAIVTPGAGPVLLVVPDAPLPVARPGAGLSAGLPGAGLSVAGGGFDLTMTVTEPVRRMRVTAQGTAMAYDDPADALAEADGGSGDTGGSGRKADVELDLTWTTDGIPYRWRRTTRYEMPCWVTGHVVVDGERVDVDWIGQRDHSWGNRDWWAFGWCWMAVHLDDGSRWHVAGVPVMPGVGMGCFSRDGHVTEVAGATVTADVTPRGLFGDTTARVDPGGHELVLSPVGFAPVRLDAPDGRVSFFPRATCRVTTADGRRGVGWLEWNLPQDTP
jgi:hypothetical protein